MITYRLKAHRKGQGFCPFLKRKIPTSEKDHPSVRVLNRSAELSTCEATHLKLLTDRSFQDALQQQNTSLHQTQSQVRELTLNDHFLTS